MKYHLISGVAFALVMFLIPLLALNGRLENVQPLPIGNSNVQVAPENVASDTSSASQSQPLPEAPAVEVDGDGFRLRDERTGKIFEVSAREYACGSLAAEMPPTFHPEALKAQAVASHTYALNLRRQSRADPDAAFDFTVDPSNWKGYVTEKQFRERYGDLADAYWKAITEAAGEVYGYILTYEDEPIVAAYHSMSSGVTEDASNVWTGGKPYLVPVESRGDTLAPDYTTEVRISAQELSRALQSAYPGITLGNDPSGWLRIDKRSQSGYVTQLAAGNLTIHGKELRTLLDLRSSDFSIIYDGNAFLFTVKGYGHGVGLSQYGADYMARQGTSFDEILMHYYPGTTLSPIALLQE